MNRPSTATTSIASTYLTFGPDTNLPKLLAWTRNNNQSALFEETP